MAIEHANIHDIELKLSKLSKDKLDEIDDFVDFLLKKYQEAEISKKNFVFDWAGGLSDLNCSSVELQHKATDLQIKFL